MGSGHGRIVLIHGAALLNNLQKVLGLFQGHWNISHYAAPRSACYPEETQLTVKGSSGGNGERSIRQQKPSVRCWRLLGKCCSG